MKDLIARHPYAALLVGILLVLGMAALAFTADLRSGRRASPSSAAIPAGAEGLDEAPDFALERLNGETFRLSDHRGKVVALNFWATWCPPCREEIPELIALQEEMKGDVLFVGWHRDRRELDEADRLTGAAASNATTGKSSWYLARTHCMQCLLSW